MLTIVVLDSSHADVGLPGLFRDAVPPAIVHLRKRAHVASESMVLRVLPTRILQLWSSFPTSNEAGHSRRGYLHLDVST